MRLPHWMNPEVSFRTAMLIKAVIGLIITYALAYGVGILLTIIANSLENGH